MECQRDAPPVDQQMSLSPRFAQVRGVGPRRFAPERSSQQLGVGRLPLPVDPAASVIPLKHQFHNAVDDPCPCPLLKAAMGGRSGAVATGKSLPVAAGAQNEEDAINHLAERHGWTPWGTRFFFRWEQGTNALPHLLRDSPDGGQLRSVGFSSILSLTHRLVLSCDCPTQRIGDVLIRGGLSGFRIGFYCGSGDLEEADNESLECALVGVAWRGS